jgi:hypothetical protein
MQGACALLSAPAPHTVFRSFPLHNMHVRAAINLLSLYLYVLPRCLLLQLARLIV